MPDLSAKAFVETRTRIAPYVIHTPTLASPGLGPRVTLKLESAQVTGSFKARGAFSKVTSLTDAERAKGFVAASTGNHGLATARAAVAFDTTATIYLPTDAAPTKVQRLEAAGAKLVFVGHDCLEAEVAARHAAQDSGATYVSPYNDPQVVLGQGTIGVELLEDIPDLDAVFVSVGGGGLVSGIAAYLKTVRPGVTVVGCSPANSPVMYEYVRSGRLIPDPNTPTLSDGTAGGVEAGSITLDLCATLVDRWVLVSEKAIAAAMRELWDQHQLMVEGSVGVAAAAYLELEEAFRMFSTAIIVCGGNIDEQSFEKVVGLG